jgi:hypothetical protein
MLEVDLSLAIFTADRAKAAADDRAISWAGIPGD